MFGNSLARLRQLAGSVGKSSLAATTLWGVFITAPASAQQAVPVQQAGAQVATTSANAAVAPTAYAYQEPPVLTGEDRLQQLESQVKTLQSQLDAVAPFPKERYTIGSNLRMYGEWNNGLEFRSANRDYYFHVGGRTQWDNVYLSSPNANAALAGLVNPATGIGTNDGLQDASFFRRARLRMEGTMLDQFDWCVEYNFVNSFLAQNPTRGQDVNGTGWAQNGQSATNVISQLQGDMFNPVSPVDLWWNFREIPVLGNVQIGNQKEAFGLERLESSRYLDFMERNFGNDAFISPSANGFAPGVQVWNWTPNRRATYAVGLFKNVTNPFVYNIGDGQGEVCGRMTWLPWYDEPSGGRYFMHVGIGACQRAIDNNFINYRNRGNLRNGPDAVIPSWTNTGSFFGDYQDIVNPEFMFQYGRLFIQSEWVGNWTTNAFTANGNARGTALGTVFFDSYYIQTTYFLTGEHRIYDYQKALVGRVVPYENAFSFRRRGSGAIFGRGAWQAKARLNWIDLNDNQIHGGKILAQTYGMNWFLNPNMKMQFDFDLMQRSSPGTQGPVPGAVAGSAADTVGFIYGFGTRFAADF